jgi:hypothetical protein
MLWHWMKYVAAVLLAGCGMPAFTSAMRPPQSWPADVRVESKCVYLADPYSAGSMEGLNQTMEPDNWRLVYVSHYTSSKTLNYPTIFCFERPLVPSFVMPPTH